MENEIRAAETQLKKHDFLSFVKKFFSIKSHKYKSRKKLCKTASKLNHKVK